MPSNRLPLLTQPFKARMNTPSPPCWMSLSRKRLSFEPASTSTQAESRAWTSPVLMRSPQLRLFLLTRLRQEVHKRRQVFEVWEKSFSSMVLSSDWTRLQASQTRLALFLRSVE